MKRFTTDEAFARLARDLKPSMLWRPDGSIGAWNEAASDLYGFLEEDAVGQAHTALLQTEFSEDWASIRARLDREGSWSGTVKRVNREGESFDFVIELTESVGPDGPYVYESSRPAHAAHSLGEQQDLARTIATELERFFQSLGSRPLRN
jgi:PAS domain S-box-containing protein